MTTQAATRLETDKHLHHIKFQTGLSLLILQQTQERLAALQTRLAARK